MAPPIVPRVDSLQRRRPVVAVPVAVFKRFGEHQGRRLSAVVSYYSFFSVFPLFLVFVTVLGIVLDDRDDDLREKLVDGVLGRLPVIGTQLADTEPLQGSVWVLVVGLATALWAGLGAVGALQYGFDELADVPLHERPNFAWKRVKALAYLVAFGLGLVLATLLSNLATVFDLSAVAGAIGLVATLAVSVGLLLMTWTVLPSVRRPIRVLLPGALLGGLALVLLQQLGSFVVRHFIADASDTYGTFAVVIALLSWFHLVSRVVLLAAELNAVLAAGLWPRSLAHDLGATEADRRAADLDVQRIQRDPRFGYAMVGDRPATDQLDTSR